MMVWDKEALPDSSSIRLARIFAIGTVVAQFMTALVINKVILDPVFASSFTGMSGGELLLRDVIFSVLGTIPFVVTYVAFSVLAMEDRGPVELLSSGEAAEV